MVPVASIGNAGDHICGPHPFNAHEIIKPRDSQSNTIQHNSPKTVIFKEKNCLRRDSNPRHDDVRGQGSDVQLYGRDSIHSHFCRLRKALERICWSRIMHGPESIWFVQKMKVRSHTNFMVGCFEELKDGELVFFYVSITVYFESTICRHSNMCLKRLELQHLRVVLF